MSPSLEPVTVALHDAWRALGAALDGAAETFTDLLKRYSEPGRFYHDTRHLYEVLKVVDELSAWASDLRAVRLAAWFHDAVYDSRAADNEERSAALAEEALAPLGLPEATIAEVVRLVRLTKTHEATDGDGNAAVLLDADLAILGASPERYDVYARGIRQEYAWVAEEAYRKGRAAVLQRFLDRPRIFRTEPMFAEREAMARANVRREIAGLES